jgi:hypothetical protein
MPVAQIRGIILTMNWPEYGVLLQARDGEAKV